MPGNYIITVCPNEFINESTTKEFEFITFFTSYDNSRDNHGSEKNIKHSETYRVPAGPTSINGLGNVISISSMGLRFFLCNPVQVAEVPHPHLGSWFLGVPFCSS